MGLTKLLITGSSGLIGKILWGQLQDSFELYGMDIVITEPSIYSFRADISDYAQIANVLRNIVPLSYIVHLAGDSNLYASWESVLKNNIIGTKNVYEAAKNFNVKRVIFASSNHVTAGHERFLAQVKSQSGTSLITTAHSTSPTGFYGVSKAFGEAIARMYIESYGLESICLRIGTVIEDDNPTKDERHKATWLSHRDLGQLINKSIISNIKFGIYYGVSANRQRIWDISDAIAELGYQPQDDASEKRERI